MSNGVYKIFLPALIFIAMLDTLNDSEGKASSQEWWIPLFFSVVVSIITMVVGFLLSRALARNKAEFTKRTIFMCIVLGNSNSMPLLIMKSLCDSFQPLQEKELCFMKATTYGTLYNTFFIFLGFSVIYPYVLDADDDQEHEEQPLLGETPPRQRKTLTCDFITVIKRSLLAPPTATVILTSSLRWIPGFADVFLKDNSPLRSVTEAIELVGSVAVPMSSVIVGGDLYESLTSHRKCSDHRKEFGNGIVAMICLIRLVLFPFVGRWLYTYFGLQDFIALKELGVFMLTEFGVVTANNAMIIAGIITAMYPRRGETMKRDVAKCLFLQYLVAPVLVTLNTALALQIQYDV
ncbi:Protein PIN-LIKES 5 [Gracilariopsis chorda]|uniref:Protein PIN-LIKES 5 n=1 Tax=Gracilariopsis chorda TaxID=448386 RepID=A0A2V3IXQ6_9FLOR|nr:Protein PIN-LIKES 5 [Gracilariopsis chorda]|eukprot:PXF46922.1 Protein PIN-LIKES 5 [Gracilariopsis chorda]